ncbi:MAG TPA: hypothetical protein VNO35_05370 [Steroidobacteraceae bacterium]|nr:hypothetical protein [Steroidobacteraceae bacterium]
MILILYPTADSLTVFPNGAQRHQMRCFAGSCGFEENADLIGAINVLRAGHARCACEVSEI